MTHTKTSTLCKKCGVNMVIRTGKYGRFLACPSSNPSDNHGTYSYYKEVSKQSWEFRCSLDADDQGEYFDMLAPY
jgi:ssDNA-binding Zn-finger/Zn-ribbon topoisomerase 1